VDEDEVILNKNDEEIEKKEDEWWRKAT